MSAYDFTAPVSCPDSDALAAFHHGDLVEPALEAVADHLAGCPRCQSALATLPEVALLAHLRAPAPDEPLLQESECALLEAQARTIRLDEPTAASARPDRSLPRWLGQYRLLEEIGRGGMGTVYKAEHTKLRRLVAVKMLRDDCLHDPAVVARFFREMELVGRLDHPHIVRALDANAAAGGHFLVMEYAAGLDLARLLDWSDPPPVADACECVRQAALGLHYVHEHGLVHRDVKPSNLLLTLAGRVQVLDLGLARLHEQAEAAERLTRPDQVMGTADYMAPEQGYDSRAVDIRADVYGLGCTLYKLLTGQAPFGDPKYNTALLKMTAHAHLPVPPVRGLRPEVPEGLAAVLDRMLAKKPDERYATPAEAAAALEPFAAGSDLPRLVADAVRRRDEARPAVQALTGPFAPTAPSVTRVRTPLTRRQRLLWLGACAAALLIGLGGLTLAFLYRPGPPESPGPSEVSGSPEAPAPGVWHELLHREPERLALPGKAPRMQQKFDGEKQELWVDSTYAVLFPLGESRGAVYELQVTVHQNNWAASGAGMFFGRHPARDERGRPCVQYQLVELPPVRPPPVRLPKPPTRSLAWSLVIEPTAPGASFEQRGLKWVEVPSPVPGDHLLRLVVGPEGLRHVFWDLQERGDLLRPLAKDQLAGVSPHGTFGLYNHNGASTFCRPRFRYFEGDDHDQSR